MNWLVIVESTEQPIPRDRSEVLKDVIDKVVGFFGVLHPPNLTPTLQIQLSLMPAGVRTIWGSKSNHFGLVGEDPQWEVLGDRLVAEMRGADREIGRLRGATLFDLPKEIFYNGRVGDRYGTEDSRILSRYCRAC